MIKAIKSLKKQGLMGINKRNAAYILNYNSRHLYPIVDDKLKTKELASQAGIPIPQLYGAIKTSARIKNLSTIIAGYDKFVIKPAHGAGGEGIIVITGQVQHYFRQVQGRLLKLEDLTFHIANILAGMHSLGGYPDNAIIEYCVKADPVFTEISYQGVPDLRIIVLLGYPIMAMARLPTHTSSGKANLHQGAVGAGVDLASGLTLGGVWHNNAIEYHPDTLKLIAGIQVPYWDTILTTAAKCYELTQLGYIGVDIVLDQDNGPLMLEINARPGLNIQIANRIGLQHRANMVEKRSQLQESVGHRVAFVKKAFASQSEVS